MINSGVDPGFLIKKKRSLDICTGSELKVYHKVSSCAEAYMAAFQSHFERTLINFPSPFPWGTLHRHIESCSSTLLCQVKFHR